MPEPSAHPRLGRVAAGSDLIRVAGTCGHVLTVPEYVLARFRYHGCEECGEAVEVKR